MNLLIIHTTLIKISVLCYIIIMIRKFIKRYIAKNEISKEEKQKEFNDIINEAKWILNDRGIEILKYLYENILVSKLLILLLCFIPILNIFIIISMMKVISDTE